MDMKLPFTKMQSLGNDFVVFDFTQTSVALSAAQAQHIADRHLGIGCDQILIVEQSVRDDIDFKYRILNADGSEVGQCGNGARCFAKFVREQGLSKQNSLRVETISGEMTLSLLDNGHVAVEMDAAIFIPQQIPFIADQEQVSYDVEVLNHQVKLSTVEVGNPHAVILVDDVAVAPVADLGPALESHPLFPERVNVGFMQVNDRDDISLRVFERGAGETRACGSGAVAAAVIGQNLGLLESKVIVHQTGGDLTIECAGKGQNIIMTGPAHTSYTGIIHL